MSLKSKKSMEEGVYVEVEPTQAFRRQCKFTRGELFDIYLNKARYGDPQAYSFMERMASEEGEPMAQAMLAYEHLTKYWDPSEQALVKMYGRMCLKWLQNESPHCKYAQFLSGHFFQFGIAVSEDSTESTRLYRMAAEQGLSLAQFKYAGCLREGNGVDKNTSEAMKWYTLAADQGIPEAQFAMADTYETGDGATQDLQLALKYYRMSAAAGTSTSQRRLGECYEKGILVEKDMRAALKHYQERR
jgi:TPR repeat protein